MVADRFPNQQEVHEHFEKLQRELERARQRIIDSEERVTLLEQLVDNLRAEQKRVRRSPRIPNPLPGREA